MATITLAQAIANRNAAKTVYATAVAAFRTAYGTLMGWDMLLASHGVDVSQGFGEPINTVQLRHSQVNPGEGGSLGQDALPLVRNIQIVG
jgi:hypothetical protein